MTNTNTKTYEVPFQGRVDYTVRVEASNPSEAIMKARELRDEINLKQGDGKGIYVNGWFNDEWDDDVEEIDLVAEEASIEKSRYIHAKMKELGDDNFCNKTYREMCREYDARLNDNLNEELEKECV